MSASRPVAPERLPRPDQSGIDPDLPAVREAQRDRAAFGILYRRYLDRVYAYAFYQLEDHHDAEDATERTFVAALHAIDRFRDDGRTFRAWLFRIAHNTLANARRTRRRRPTTPLDEALDTSAVNGPDPAHVVARAEEVRQVRRALAALPEERRQVVLLRFVDGLSAQEIGMVLGRSQGAVRVLQHRALRELADRLDA